jgi:hypothetical protein
MPRRVWRDGLDSFNQDQIDVIDRAIERAWSVIKYTDNVRPEHEAREVLTRCVMAAARTGERDHIVLVNRAILSFRAKRARMLSQSRRRRG